MSDKSYMLLEDDEYPTIGWLFARNLSGRKTVRVISKETGEVEFLNF